jgi:hypothetical protein
MGNSLDVIFLPPNIAIRMKPIGFSLLNSMFINDEDTNDS